MTTVAASHPGTEHEPGAPLGTTTSPQGTTKRYAPGLTESRTCPVSSVKPAFTQLPSRSSARTSPSSHGLPLASTTEISTGCVTVTVFAVQPGTVQSSL